MTSQRVRKAFELFANGKVKLISKQIDVEQALARVVEAADRIADGGMKIWEAENCLSVALTELEQALKDVGV